MNDSNTVDVLVIGGGVNGTGIARDAAGRGLSVQLCEKDDLSQGTSSRSGKLVHGGLRYLEHFEFRLVREALIEREVLLRSAPHIIWPMRFVLPHSPRDRPAWLIRLGLFLYDHLGGRKKLAATRTLKLGECVEGEPLQPQFKKGFEYADCWVDDSRLVLLNALDACKLGASVSTRTEFQSARRVGGFWEATLVNQYGEQRTVNARAIVNAAGPWVNQIINKIPNAISTRKVRLVKGSHIVLRKFWNGNQAYLLQNTDNRVIFVNPYQKHYALIGTTDIALQGAPESAVVKEKEITYLLQTVNRYFSRQQLRSDVVHSFTGVRPLYDDNSKEPSAVTRDYVIEVNDSGGAAPLVSVFGGKITTYRKLSEQLVDRLKPYFGSIGPPWTRSAILPGGNIAGANYKKFLVEMQQQYAWLDTSTIEHLARSYGTLMPKVLHNANSLNDMGLKFAPEFYEREAIYLTVHEWASSVDDVLTRRTKHGLHMTVKQKAHFQHWWMNNVAHHKNPVGQTIVDQSADRRRDFLYEVQDV